MSICCIPSVMFSAKCTLTSVTSMVPVHSMAFWCENADFSTLFGLKPEGRAQALQASLSLPPEPSSSHTVLIPHSPSSHPGTKWVGSFSWI